jgi:hypothetical protein
MYLHAIISFIDSAAIVLFRTYALSVRLLLVVSVI